jgi:phosphopantothenoylcysteine decarboxylase/phosphopantothenate--cysteine ligase
MRRRPLHLLVTAGPTREPIDPVRFLSNRSSGIFGYAVAQAAARRGHRVVLLSSPTALASPPGVRVEPFETADELAGAMRRWWRWCDVVVMTAAVSDFRPRRRAASKLARTGRLRLDLVATPDIIGAFGRRKGCRVLVGCALESAQMQARAVRKLVSKRLDLMVATSVGRGRGGSPFGNRPMRTTLLGADGSVRPLGRCTKAALARRLLDRVERLCYRRTASPVKS